MWPLGVALSGGSRDQSEPSDGGRRTTGSKHRSTPHAPSAHREEEHVPVIEQVLIKAIDQVLIKAIDQVLIKAINQVLIEAAMPVICAAIGCNNKFVKGSEIRFYR